MEENIVLNLDNIIAYDFPSVIRQTAQQLKTDGYLNLAKFFSGLSTEDLDMLGQLCDNALQQSPADGRDRGTQCLTALTAILVIGEGTADTIPSEFYKHVTATITYITMEKLAREGLIEFYRDAISYTYSTDTIAKLKQ